MEYYKLDENNCPRLTDITGYYEWKNALPEEKQTGIGFRVDKTERGGVCVSTVFLGLDHGGDGGPPVLWETIVFGGEHDQDCERYTSQKEAEQGHRLMCEKYLP